MLKVAVPRIRGGRTLSRGGRLLSLEDAVAAGGDCGLLVAIVVAGISRCACISVIAQGSQIQPVRLGKQLMKIEKDEAK